MNQSSQLAKKSSKNIKKAENLFIKAYHCYKKGDLELAFKFAQQSIALDKKNDACQNLAGTILHQNGQNASAIKFYKQAIKYNPDYSQYYYNIGIVLNILRNPEESLKYQEAGLKLDPDNLSCLNEAGLLCIALDNPLKAKKYLYKAYEINPQDVTTLVNVAFHCIKSKLLNEAISFAEQAIRIDPDCAEAYNTIGLSLIMANIIEKGIEYIQISLSKSDKNAAEKHHSILMNLLYSTKISNEDIFHEHKFWADKFLDFKKFSHNKNQDPHKKLKIGFVSSDLMEHSVAHFLFAIFDHYDKKQYDYYCYSGTIKLDWVSDKIKQKIDVWRDINKLTASESATLIKNDEIDILVDLGGHSNSSNINIFAYKPAPVQFTYLGYPFSSGLESIDYRISDEYADPTDLTEHLHTEKLVRISPSFLCYNPLNLNTSITDTPPLDRKNFITFGSFNNLNKLSDVTIEMWASILKRVNHSMLALKSSLDTPGLQKENIVAQFQSHGVSISRLLFFDRNKERTDHISRYNDIDISLDTYPYNGTTTMFESLWMGVPVISLSGNSHPSRVGNSILHNMNLSNLIAESTQEYINIAIDLANNPDQIRAYRKNLRQKLMSSPLTDAKSFSLKFDKVMRDAWQQYCATTN